MRLHPDISDSLFSGDAEALPVATQNASRQRHQGPADPSGKSGDRVIPNPRAWMPGGFVSRRGPFPIPSGSSHKRYQPEGKGTSDSVPLTPSQWEPGNVVEGAIRA